MAKGAKHWRVSKNMYYIAFCNFAEYSLSPNTQRRVIAQSPKPIYSQGKAYLLEQPPWRAAADSHLAGSRSQIQVPALSIPLPAG